jgi:DNA-binding XRE family transcriptional regulator
MKTQNLSLLDIGRTIKTERLARKMNQADLANKSSLSRQTIISLEKGADVSSLSLMRVLAAMGCCLEIKPVRPDYRALGDMLDES